MRYWLDLGDGLPPVRCQSKREAELLAKLYQVTVQEEPTPPDPSPAAPAD